jgi:hypothetical protein
MMKLTAPGIEQTLSQYESQVLPESHPAFAELSRVFGNHTFFLDGSGLNIVEPTTSPADGGTQTAQVVRLASWNDPAKSSLAPHDPEPTEIVVMLDAAA